MTSIPLFRRLAAGFVCIAISAIVPASIASSQAIPFDRSAYQSTVEHPTRITVLGMTHLQDTPEGWDPTTLDPLLERLARFRPDAILVEALPPESIETLWRFRADYPGSFRPYAAYAMQQAALTRSELEMDIPQAQAAMRIALREKPDSPSPAWRRRMAALMLAAGETDSATVQWLSLDPAERRRGDGLSSASAQALGAITTAKSETNLIGSVLAARLGLERVYPIDDHASDDLEAAHESDFGPWFSSPEVQAILNDPRFAGTRDNSDKLGSPEDLLATIRRINAGLAAGEAELLDTYLRYALARTDGVARAARVHLASLEARNMRQAANIREVSGDYPGGNILVIIGVSHVPWLSSILREMPDVELVPVEEVLADSQPDPTPIQSRQK